MYPAYRPRLVSLKVTNVNLKEMGKKSKSEFHFSDHLAVHPSLTKIVCKSKKVEPRF